MAEENGHPKRYTVVVSAAIIDKVRTIAADNGATIEHMADVLLEESIRRIGDKRGTPIEPTPARGIKKRRRQSLSFKDVV